MIDDEVQLQREMNRAAKSAELFRNEIFQESFDVLVDQYKTMGGNVFRRHGDPRATLLYVASGQRHPRASSVGDGNREDGRATD